jgi:hypothetical protein
MKNILKRTIIAPGNYPRIAARIGLSGQLNE